MHVQVNAYAHVQVLVRVPVYAHGHAFKSAERLMRAESAGHVHGDPGQRACACKRPQDVRRVLAELPEVWGCSHIHLLWDEHRAGKRAHAPLRDGTRRHAQLGGGEETLED